MRAAFLYGREALRIEEMDLPPVESHDLHAVSLLPMLDMDRLITASYPLDEAITAFYATRDRDAVKVVLEP